MSNHDNGGSAFPYLDSTSAGLSCREPGMTLRDCFAAKSMQGLAGKEGSYECWGYLAEDAYAMADAMLEARETPND